jgi:uncharacterized membrane protein
MTTTPTPEADVTPAEALITDPLSIAGVLLLFLAILFQLHRQPRTQKLFKIIPLLVFAYFVPALLSNTGVIPLRSPLYDFVKNNLLPASLILLVLSVDIPAILRLGRNAVILFLAATFGIVVSGPLAYLALGWMIPPEMSDQAWRGLAAVAGSWIGGGANFVAIGSSVGASESTMGAMVVVDVAVANVWMAVLLFFAGREKEMDAKIGADRASLDEVRHKVEKFQKEVQRPTNLPDLLAMVGIAIGGTALANFLSQHLPVIEIPGVGPIIKGFTWVVLIVTTIGVILSFTRARNLEGAGASSVGSVLLYLLVTTIGAKAEFAEVIKYKEVVLVGALWMTMHAVSLLAVRRFLKAPIFFAAVGSKANVGGAASAPILASAFHPALAPVGVLLAIGGYVLGTYAGLLCGILLGWVSKFYSG